MYNESSFSYLKVKPAEINQQHFQNLELFDLVTKGYEYTGTQNELLESAYQEYDFHDKEDRITIFLALANGKAVGSLTAVDWSITEPIRGTTFWQNLKKQNESIFQRAKSYSPSAVEIIGSVTHPDFRRKGISSKLHKKVVETFTPSVVLAQTKHLEKF